MKGWDPRDFWDFWDPRADGDVTVISHTWDLEIWILTSMTRTIDISDENPLSFFWAQTGTQPLDTWQILTGIGNAGVWDRLILAAFPI